MIVVLAMALAALALFQQHALSLGLRKKESNPKREEKRKELFRGNVKPKSLASNAF